MTLYYCPACGWSEQAEHYGEWLAEMRAHGHRLPRREDFDFTNNEGDPPF